MKKYIFIGLIILICIELIAQIVVSIFARKNTSINGVNQTNPQLQQLFFPKTKNNNTTSNKFTITAVSPADGSTNISLLDKVRITFNKKISPKDITAWLGPNVIYTTDVHDYWLIIIPSSPLEQNTTYSFAVKFSDGTVSQTYSFTTTGPAVTPTPNPHEDTYGEVSLSRDKVLHPDNYVNYFLPKSADTFYANSVPTDTPTPHIYFSVILMGNNSNQSKQDFISYVKSLGLTDDQIQKLDVRYESPEINAH